MERIEVDLKDRSYTIHIGDNAWQLLPEFLGDPGRGGKIMVVTDDRVGGLYAERLMNYLSGHGAEACFHSIPEGEASKSFSHLEGLCRRMAEQALDRDCLVLAMGGGVVGDLAGLAASVYLRGVHFVQLPTSLLAMVDSSVGGKTGINIPEGKNLVGTFHQPTAVFIDTSVLPTLSARDWYAGMAEVLKIALTLDPSLFGYLEEVRDLGPSGGVDPVRIVSAACRRKAEIVREDERESGLRRVLNFGHTAAHALEASLGYGVIRHGEAVVLGMMAALELSRRLCGLPDGGHRRAMEVLSRVPVPVTALPEEAAGFLSRDKKSRQGEVTAVLLEDIGKVALVPLDRPEDLVDALRDALDRR
ncbi:MAG: 3-dehydroquinate synthase [bacterium]|nr:MAG: 3-dehydroquinate synthase [bacterium]